MEEFVVYVTLHVCVYACVQRLREDFHKMKQEKEELEVEFEELTSRSTSQSEVRSHHL